MENISREHLSQDMTSSIIADYASQADVTAMFTEVFDRFQNFAIIKHKNFYPTQYVLDKIIEIANKIETYSSALNETSKVKYEEKIHGCLNHIEIPETEKKENEIVLVEFLNQIVNTVLLLSKSKRFPVDLVQIVVLTFVVVVRKVGSHWMNIRDADIVMNPLPEIGESSRDISHVKLDTKESQTSKKNLPIIEDKAKNMKDSTMISYIQVGTEVQTELTAMFTEVLARLQDFVFLKYRDFYPSSIVLYKFIEITNKFEKYFLHLNSSEKLKSLEIEIKQCTDHLVVLITENNENEILLVDFIKHIIKTVLFLANSKTLPLALVQTMTHSFLSVINQVGSHWIQLQNNAPPRDLPTNSTTIPGKDLPTNSTTIRGKDLPTNSTTIRGKDLPTNSTTIRGKDLPTNSTTISGKDLPTNSTTIRGKARKAQRRISKNMTGMLTELLVLTNVKVLYSNQAFDRYVSSFLEALRLYLKFTENPSKATWKITRDMFSELDMSQKQVPNADENITFSNLAVAIQRFVIDSHGSEAPPQSVTHLVTRLIESLELYIDERYSQNSSEIVCTDTAEISKNIQVDNMTKTSMQNEVVSQINCNKMFSDVLNVGRHVQNIALPKNSQSYFYDTKEFTNQSRAQSVKVKKLKDLKNLKVQMIQSKLTGIQDIITNNSLARNQVLDNHVCSFLEALRSYSEFCENHLKESFTNARTKFIQLAITPKQLPKTDPNRTFLKLVEEIQAFIVNTHGFEIPPNRVHTNVIALINALENLLKTTNRVDSEHECLLEVSKVRTFLKQHYHSSTPCEVTYSRLVKFIEALESYVLFCTNGSPCQWSLAQSKLNKVHSYDPKKMNARDFCLLQHSQKVKTAFLNSKGERLSNQVKDELKALITTLKSILHEANVQKEVAMNSSNSSLNVNTAKHVPHKTDFNAECLNGVTKTRNFLENTYRQTSPCDMTRNIVGDSITALQSYVAYCTNGKPDQAMDARTKLSKVLSYESKKLKNCNLQLVQHLARLTTLILESKGKRPSNDVRDALKTLTNVLIKIVPNESRKKVVTTNTNYMQPITSSNNYVQPVATNLKNTQQNPSTSNYVQPIATSSKNWQLGPTTSNHLPQSAVSTGFWQPIPTTTSFIPQSNHTSFSQQSNHTSFSQQSNHTSFSQQNNHISFSHQSTNTSFSQPSPSTSFSQPSPSTSFSQQSTKTTRSNTSNATSERSNDRYEKTKRDIYLINLLEEVKLATDNYARTPCPTFQDEISDAIRQLKRWSDSWGKSSKEKSNADIQHRAIFDFENIVGHIEMTPKETAKVDFVSERYNLRSNNTSKAISKHENKTLPDKQTEKTEVKLTNSATPSKLSHHTPSIQKVNYSEKLVMTNHVLNKTINRYAFDEISLTRQQIQFLRSATEKIPLEPNDKSVQYCRNILAELKSLVALDNSGMRDLDILIKSLEYSLTGNEPPASYNVQETDYCIMNGNERYLQSCEREFDGAAYETCVQNTIDDLLKFEENARTLIEIEIAEEVNKSGDLMDESVDSCSSDDGEWSDVSDENMEYVNNFTITKEDNRLVVELHDAFKLNEDCDTNTPFPVIVTLADDETIDLTNKKLIHYKAFMLLLDETEDKVKLEFPTVSAFLLFVKENQSLVERLELVSKGSSSLPRAARYNTSGLDVKCVDFLQSENCIRDQVNNLMSVFEECKRSKAEEKSLLRDLSLAVKNIYPNHVLHVFGSRATGQALPDSDYDIFCDVTGNEYIRGMNHTHQGQCVVQVAAALKKISVQRGVLFTTILSLTKTRVPIVKVFHKQTQMNCDISFKDGTSMENTHLLNMYLSLDSRVPWLLTAVKLWAHYNHIQGSSYFTSHGLTWLLLFYLMKVGVVPSVMQIQSSTIPKVINNWDVSFQAPKNWCSRNTITNVQLFKDFFTWLAHTDFSSYCLCTFTGEQISKNSMTNINWMKNYNQGVFKNWAQRILMKRPRSQWNLSSYDMIETNGNSGLCVQDPFEHSKNVTKAVKGAKFVNFLQLSKETCRLLE